MSFAIAKTTPRSLTSSHPLTFLDEFFNDYFFVEGSKPPANFLSKNTSVKENDDSYEIFISAPGVHKEDFDISLEGRLLTVSYEVTKEENRRLFCPRSFQRSWKLPMSTRTEAIEASHKHGVLSLKVLKPEGEVIKKQTIAIA